MAKSMKAVSTAEEGAELAPRIRPSVAARLFEEAQAMELEDAKGAGMVGYMGRALVQATLPYKEPNRNLQAWGRRAGNVSLMIQPGTYIDRKTNEPASIGYPFGSYPRLLLAWLATEALRTKEKRLVLGDTLKEFMESLGYTSLNGGPRGNITLMREQMKRLFGAHISVVYGGEDHAPFSAKPYSVADESSLWWDPQQPEQAGLFESSVTLSQRFFDEIISAPVPIQLRALRALRQSPMALDLYCWLTYRMFSLKAPTTVPWEAMQQQFGSGAKAEKKFRETVKRALQQVIEVYPAAVTPTRAGLLLEPSRTSVRRLVAGWEAPPQHQR